LENHAPFVCLLPKFFFFFTKYTWPIPLLSCCFHLSLCHLHFFEILEAFSRGGKVAERSFFSPEGIPPPPPETPYREHPFATVWELLFPPNFRHKPPMKFPPLPDTDDFLLEPFPFDYFFPPKTSWRGLPLPSVARRAGVRLFSRVPLTFGSSFSRRQEPSFSFFSNKPRLPRPAGFCFSRSPRRVLSDILLLTRDGFFICVLLGWRAL